MKQGKIVLTAAFHQRRQWHPTPVLLPGKSHGRRSLEGCSPWGCWGSDTTERLHFHTLEKEMVTHSSVLAGRIPGMGEPGGLLSMGLHRVGHNWSNLAAAAAFHLYNLEMINNTENRQIKYRMPSEIWISDNSNFVFCISMTHAMFQIYLKDLLLFIWNSNFPRHHLFLLAIAHVMPLYEQLWDSQTVLWLHLKKKKSRALEAVINR